MIGSLVILTLLSACAPNPNTTGCAWTKPIVLDNEAFLIFLANPHPLRGLTDEINEHNDARKVNCGS